MFTIRNFETKTLSWWHTQSSKMDFNPPYQRKGKLWTNTDKAFLIDSILNSFDLPKIYIADFTFMESKLKRTNKPYAIIDGKQRFEAIFDFFDGKTVLNKDFIYLENTDIDLSGLGYKDLKNNYPEIAAKFDNYNLAVVSIITDETSKINELFIRLNKSKALNGAELRNAMQGEVPQLIRDISNHPFFIENIKFSVSRGQDNNTSAKLLLSEFRGKLVDVQKSQLDRFVKDAINAEYDFSIAKSKVLATLDKMHKIFLKKDQLLKSSGLIPIYYFLTRNNENKNVREFLVKFNSERSKVNKMDEKDISSPEQQDLAKFNSLSRSLNSQTALNKCYEILIKYYNKSLL